MRREGLRRTSIVPKASRLDPFGCDIGTRSFDLDPLIHIVANGDPHCFGFLINTNDVRYGPHLDGALVDLPGHLKILCATSEALISPRQVLKARRSGSGQRGEAAGVSARYCGKPQLYQGLVQYTKVKPFCSAFAARSNASSGISNARISSSASAWPITPWYSSSTASPSQSLIVTRGCPRY